MFRKSVTLLFLIASTSWGCPGDKGSDTTTKNLMILFGIYSTNEARYHCEPEENARTQGAAPNFTLSSSTLNQVLVVEDGVYGDGGTAYLVGTVNFSGLGKDNPMGIVYTEQDHGLESNPYRFLYPLWETAAGELIQDYGKSEAPGSRSTTTAFPIGATPGYFAPSAGYDNFGSNRLGTDFILPVPPSPSIPFHQVTNNTPQTCEEYKFRPDQSGVFGSALSGLGKIWQSRKKLNINLIFIDGVVTDQTAAGMADMIQELKDIYAQDTVKIDVTVTTAVVNSPGFVTIADLSDDFGDIANSLGTLYRSNPSGAQDVNSLNIYITRDYVVSSSAPAGILGISSGIPGIPVAGTPKSGMIVFVENHRTPGGPANCDSVGEDLCTSDQVFLAKTIAHEGAHFLGLYHLVEKDVIEGMSFTDPLPETPECRDQNGNDFIGLGECLGEGFFNSGGLNLMFWAGNPEINQTQITGEQGWVLRSHPLVY
ncbi:pappalysin-1 domain protein [Leptospira ellisii]|uniref:Pappalysin-1 domain protein n=1 Tax=Leptospira ellisii TaxID=2023197 RepID=A0A2N0BPQ0_9LEPT|nr:pappalysin-1 domain protein [Leptospira ellisii]MDV6237405.1 pappalysin-1 domain protein [Leptospira ellisii]PJZ94665.1 pappalysin-1 domain protein [Leptospira ellisii]PKA05938.1 pappalysin-1 domain protein [Leptospira ellisii]